MRTFSKLLVAVLLTTTVAGVTATTASANYLDSGEIAPWAYDAVLDARNTNIMQGGTDNRFRPLDAITRQEAAAILVKLLKLDASAFTAITFTDVKGKDWGWKEIEAVKKAGLMLGDGTQFRPQDKITREELAVILVKAAGIDTAGKEAALTVADQGRISPWAKAYVQTALEQKLMRGDGTNFNPQSEATRQEVAVMAANYKALQGTPAPDPDNEPTTPTPEPEPTPEPTPEPGDGTPEDLSALNAAIRSNPSFLLHSVLRDAGLAHVSNFAPTTEAYTNSLKSKQTAANRDLTRAEIQQVIDEVNIGVILEVATANDAAGLTMALEAGGITAPKAVLADLYMQQITALPHPLSLTGIQAAITATNSSNTALAAALTNVDAAIEAGDAAALLTALQSVSGLVEVKPEHGDVYLIELSMEREFNRDYALSRDIVSRVVEMVNFSL